MEGTDYERHTKCIAYDAEKIALADCTGFCIYWMVHYPYPPIQFNDTARLISYATGLEIDEPESMKIARRVGNLIRAYHVLSGLTRNEDTVPERFFRERPTPPKLPLDHGKFESLIDAYYEFRGWDPAGIPRKETLVGLGLNDVKEELQRRGFYGVRSPG